MKKFTLVSLARAKKSATSALMGLAILFVTLSFVSATLSTKVYSSNADSSENIGLSNNDAADDAFPFWGTGLQNNDAEEEQNLPLSTVARPASTDEFFRKDLNLLDFEDSLYGHFSFHCPNLTKTLSERRFDDPQDQERYKSALDYYEAKKSEHELLEDYMPKNDLTNSDYFDDLKQETFKMFNVSQAGTAVFNGDPFENETIILTCDNGGAGNLANRPNLPNTATQPSSLPVPRRASDTVAFSYDKGGSSSDDDSSYSEGGSFHRDGSPNLLAQAPDISPPSGLWKGTSGSHCSPKAISTYHFYSPGAAGGNEADDFPSVLYSTNNHFSYPPDTK